MDKVSREFQVFAKPTGSSCNLACLYCYYLKKNQLFPKGGSSRMADDVLEEYIRQHIRASSQPVIRFSWHGGEPTLLGLDYFHKILTLQRKYQPPNQSIANGIQTNGTLLNDDWCRFLAEEKFFVGLSLDGPQEFHDQFRITKSRKSTFEQTMRGYELLRKHGVYYDILCVVNAFNVKEPDRIYGFFKQIEAPYLNFLPLVEPQPESDSGVSSRSVPAEAWGIFLCTIFDEWKQTDIEIIKVHVFEEAARTAFGQEQALCIFRKTCGDIPVIERNGDFFSCDHYVEVEHRLGNIKETSLSKLLESPAQRAFGQAKLKTLPQYCRRCEVRVMCNGECPKNRFLQTPDGQAGLNYLCAGYKRFFTHYQPFVAELRKVWRQKKSQAQVSTSQTGVKTGRNDPCPCGSGRKYKKCCMGH